MLPLGRKNSKISKIVALHFSEEGLAIAVNLRTSDKRKLLSSQFFSQAELKSNPLLVKDFINAQKLAKYTCTIILPTSDYQMLLTEAPSVDVKEMCDALWWKVKDLVSVEYENAQIDYLELPENTGQQQGKKVYAIVADREKIAQKVAFAKELGLTPNIVETTESALLHLGNHLCTQTTGTSLLYLNKEQSSLMLMSQSTLYLSRHLQYNYLDKVDAVALDVQRSMDYYESQLGMAPCLNIIVSPIQEVDCGIMQVLANNLNATIETVDLNDLINSDQPLSTQEQQHCFIAIASILRSHEKAI